ncbi:MAG: hypothetical protein GQ531_09890 [Sulfurovum sp.]|nr:hypothetical protein [Sulfurovum sp.]
MDKSFMVYIAIGIGFMYLITRYVGDIQAEDDKYSNNAHAEEMKYAQYNAVDSIGQDILDVTGVDATTQFKAWNKSTLKEEFLEIFPNFSEMQGFVKDRIRGKILQDKLTHKLTDIEDKFFSGGMTAEEAKRELGDIK